MALSKPGLSLIFISIVMGVILFYSSSALAQDQYIQDFHFNDELSNNRIRCLIQDSMGFFWFGTNLGLNWYDGNRVVSYFALKKNGPLYFDNITDIVEGEPGEIWIGTTVGGVVLYKYSTNSFTVFEHDSRDIYSLISNQVANLTWSEGNLWVSTEKGIDKLDTNTGRFTHFSVPGMSQNSRLANVGNLQVIEELNLVLINFQRQLYAINTTAQTRVFVPFELTASLIKPGELLYFEAQGSSLFLLTTEFKFIIWDLAANEIDEQSIVLEEDILKYLSDINDVYQLSDNRFLIASDHGLLWNNEQGNWNNNLFVRNSSGDLSSNTINRIESDSAGQLWLATNHGVQFINQNHGKFHAFNISPGNQHDSHSKDSAYALVNHSIFGITTYLRGKGLYRLNEDTYELTPDVFNFVELDEDITQNKSFSLFELPDNGLLISTYGGVYSCYPDSQKVIGPWKSSHSGEVVDGIRKVIFYDQNTVIVGNSSSDSLYICDIRREEPVLTRLKDRYPHLANMITQGVYDMLVRYENEVWIAFYDSLLVFDPLTKNYTSYNYYPDEQNRSNTYKVYDLYVASDETVWLGTMMGLYSFDDETSEFVKHNVARPLSEGDREYNTIYSIIEDDQRRLWLGSMKGLILYDPGTGQTSFYTKENGLPFNEFNLGSSMKLPGGEIVMGGIDGVVKFKPQLFAQSDFKAEVKLSEVEINYRAVDLAIHPSMLETLDLEPGNNQVSLRFSVQDYSDPSNNNIRYRMGGPSQAWITKPANSRIALTNIPAGQHLLEVQAINTQGVNIDSTYQLRLNVTPSFFETPWFIGLLIVLLMLILASAHLYKTYSLEKSNKDLQEANITLQKIISEKDEISKDLKLSQQRQQNLNKILNSKIDEIYSLNNELKTYNYSISNVLRVPIRHIIGYTGFIQEIAPGNCSEEVEEILKKISKGVNELNHLIEGINLLSRVKEQDMERYDIDFSRICNKFFEDQQKNQDSSGLTFEIERGIMIKGDIVLLKIVRNSLLDNAVKFARDGVAPEIQVRLIEEGGVKYISIVDNGKGIQEGNTEKIFEPFYSFHTIGDFSGLGLSLSIVKRIVERHGGIIKARNNEHEGAEFYFTLGPDNSWVIEKDKSG
jgi:signal transduction histidine kinase/ligand-binding sensor domain-containing protein